MSRAFVKEPDGSEPAEVLPDRPISEHRNLVTPRGLHLMDDEIKRLQQALDKAKAAEDKTTLPALNRDMKYWLARRASAEVVPQAADTNDIRFGMRVTLERDDGSMQSFRIVGQDEADPTTGLLSYVAPLARALIGKKTGDEVNVNGTVSVVTAIEAD